MLYYGCENESVSCSVVSYSLCDPMDCNLPGSSVHVIPGISPTQGLNLGLPHYKQIRYSLSHQEVPVMATAFHYSGGATTMNKAIFSPSRLNFKVA